MGYENIAVPFHGWTVIRELGRGGFGTVYEIQRDQYGIVERSAMKVIAVPQDPNEITTYLRDGHSPEMLQRMYNGRDVLPDGGEFVSFTTGYNRDNVVSFVRTKNGGLHTRVWRRGNYGGYSCSCDGKKITETIRYAFGGKQTNVYDLGFRKIEERHEEVHGCC